MAKRFTDTDKWKKPFIRSLEAPYKLLWFYILDECNHAGIWEVDFEVAEIRLGEKLSIVYAIEKFGDRVKKISETKWFIPDFISFQYGELNPKNRMHLSVINILSKYGFKDLISPLQGVKDKDKDKDMEQDKDKDKDSFGKYENLLVPKMSSIFVKHNPNYPANRNKDSQSLFSIAKFFSEQGKLNGSPENHIDKVCEAWETISEAISKDNFYSQKSLVTISNHIQEILQNVLHGKSNSKNGKSQPGSTERAREFDKLFAGRYGARGSATG